MTTDDPDATSPEPGAVVDVRTARLLELLGDEDTALAACIRRVVDQAAHDGVHYAAFGNTP